MSCEPSNRAIPKGRARRPIVASHGSFTMLASLVAAVLLCGALPTDAWADGRAAVARTDDGVIEGTPPRAREDAAPPRPRLIEAVGADRKGDRPRKGMPGAEPPPDGMRRGDVPIERLIEVAEDIEPAWGRSIREKLESDRASVEQAMRERGGRLVGLAMLKERNRGLYEMKIKELQAQIEARRIAQQYHEARSAGREDDCDGAIERMREACQRAIDLQLWQRASELSSMEALIKEQREALERDAKLEGSAALVAELMDEMLASRPAIGLFEIIERRSALAAPVLPPPAAPSAQSPSQTPSQTPSHALGETPDASKGSPPPPAPGGPPRGPGRGGHRDIPPERFLEVAADISPEAADELRVAMERDREGTLRSIRQGGPRFVGLVLMRDRDTDLYRMKVEELKLHLTLRSEAIRYHDARRDGSTPVMSMAEAAMADTSNRIVTLQIEQRRREIASLATLIDGKRAALAAESRPEATAERRDAMVHDLMHAPPSPGLSELLEARAAKLEAEPIAAPVAETPAPR